MHLLDIGKISWEIQFWWFDGLKVHCLGRNSIIHIHAYNKLGILFVLQMLAPTLQQFSMLIVKNQGGEQYKLINGINIIPEA